LAKRKRSDEMTENAKCPARNGRGQDTKEGMTNQQRKVQQKIWTRSRTRRNSESKSSKSTSRAMCAIKRVVSLWGGLHREKKKNETPTDIQTQNGSGKKKKELWGWKFFVTRCQRKRGTNSEEPGEALVQNLRKARTQGRNT